MLGENGKWLVELRGDEFDLSELEDLNGVEGIEISKSSDQYFLASPQFDPLTTDREVEEVGIELINKLNGVASVIYSNWERATFGGVTRLMPDGTRKVFASCTVGGRTRAKASLSVVLPDGTIQDPGPSTMERFAKLSMTNKAVGKAMRLFGSRERNWSNLFIIFEVIESDTKGTRAIVEKGWMSTKLIERFKHTANSVGAAGDDARHGRERTHPPTNPLRLEDAQETIRNLMHCWMSSKF